MLGFVARTLLVAVAVASPPGAQGPEPSSSVADGTPVPGTRGSNLPISISLDPPEYEPPPPPTAEPAASTAGPPPEPATEDEQEDGQEDEYDPLIHSPEAVRARSWRRSGIVATSLGVALGVASIAFGTLDPCAPKGGNSCFVDARNRAALASGIPAAVLLAGGIAMTSVGTTRLRRLRRFEANVDAAAGRFQLSVGARF